MKRQKSVPTAQKAPAGKPPEGESKYAKKVRSGACMYRGNQMAGGNTCCAHGFDVAAFYRRREERERQEALRYRMASAA